MADSAAASRSKRAADAGGAPLDRIEISDAGRAAQQLSAAAAEELGLARKVLEANEGMNSDRAAQIRERLENGFYQRQDVVADVAARLTAAAQNS